jgi:predicted TIM-barrel fold metal-dependent hydrolase
LPSQALPFKAIDAWVNLNFAPPEGDEGIGYLFRGVSDRIRQGTSPEQLLELMEDAGVERAVLTAGFRGTARECLPKLSAATNAYPDAFAASLVVDPREGLNAVRLVRDAVESHGVRLIRLLALETQLPYDDRVYYPIYSLCAELGVPVGVNVGLPGPRVPGLAQHPMAIDVVCSFFPELKVIFSHVGAPWVDECVQLLVKWPSLYYMTSAYAPKHIPKQIIHYLNTRGATKVMWASDYPVVDMKRCVDEIASLEIRDEALRKRFARDNALQLLFERGDPTD